MFNTLSEFLFNTSLILPSFRVHITISFCLEEIDKMSAEKVNEKSAEPAANDYEIGVDEPAGLTELEIQTGEREVFQKTDNGIDFRTVGWPRATAIFLKGKLDQYS